MGKVKVPEDILAGARAALTAQAGAKAAVLFGSRARGCARHESDWDIALIVAEGDGLTVPDRLGFEASFKAGRAVDCIAVPEAWLDAHQCVVGTVARGLIRDGVVLSGHWDGGKLQEGVVDERVLVSRMFQATSLARAAMGEFALIGTDASGSIESDEGLVGAFVKYTSDVAEFVAKGLMVSLGLDPEHTHDMTRLARQVEEAGHVDEAEVLRRMNGLGRRDHVAHYEEGSLDGFRGRAACERLCRSLDAWVHVVEFRMEDVSAGRRERVLQAGRHLAEVAQGRLAGVARREGVGGDGTPELVLGALSGSDALASRFDDFQREVDALAVALGRDRLGQAR